MMSLLQEPCFTDQELKRLGQKFDQIKKHINISDQEKKDKRHHVKGILEQIIDIMKNVDPLFNKMFVELKYTGSYFDNLRIVDANEFDINVVLKLPVRADKILLKNNRTQFSNYGELQVGKPKEDSIIGLDHGMKGRFETLLDGHLVHPQYVLSWFQSVLTKACNQLQNRQFRVTASGPAKTLRIVFEDQPQTVDVDLVVVFRFEPEKWKESSPEFQEKILQRVDLPRRRMYLVPKRHPECPDHLWRKHFPEVEEELLNGRIAAKPVIRIMKLLRDNIEMHRVASYFIKTLVMLENEDHFKEKNYWNDAQLPTLVFRMMVKLGNCFLQQKLPHLLYRDVNLLDFPKIELQNYYHRMANILRKCKENIDNVDDFFAPPGRRSESASNQCQRIIDEAEESAGWACNIL